MDENRSLFGMELDHPGSEEMIDISRWIKMFGILLISITFLALMAFLVGWRSVAELISEEMNVGGSESKMALMVIVCVLVIVAAVVGIMAFFLLRGSGRIRTAIRMKDQVLFNNGLGDVKTFFVIYGSFSILGLVGSIFSLLK